MFKNLMVGLDGSTHGQAALKQAIKLTRQLEGQLTGVHVIDDRILKGSLLHDFSGSLGLEPQFHLTGRLEVFMESRAQSLLKAFEESCEEAGVHCRTVSPQGEVSETLSQVAEQHDLVVVGRRGASFDVDPHDSERGIARQILRQSPVRVLVTGLASSSFEHPVVAFDGSPGSYRALADAAEFAHRFSCPLTLCHVIDSDSHPSVDPLAAAERYLEPYRVSTRFEVREGPRITSLAAFMEQEGGDLLFLGYVGHSRLRDLFSGHTADAILNWVACPIWVSR